MRRYGTWLILVGLAIAVACAQESRPAPNVVARIDTNELAYDQFEDYLALNSLGGEVGLPSPVLSRLFDQFLLEELLFKVARDRGLDTSRRRSVVDRLVRSESAGQVDAAAVRTYYEGHIEEFDFPERVSFQQLLVADRGEAERALTLVRAGNSLEAAASEIGANETGGWGQNELTRENTPEAFAETIFGLEEGQVSEIVEAEYGFLLFEVTRRFPAERLALEEAEPRVRETLEREAADRSLEALVGEASERYNVQVFGQNLPFQYQGKYQASN